MKRSDLPLQRASRRLDHGLFLKRLAPGRTPPLEYIHRDDYAVFGVVERGGCRAAVDFAEYQLTAGDLMCVQPGQVHRIVDAGDAEATLLLVDEALVPEAARSLFAAYALAPAPVRIDASSFDELRSLFAQIARRCGAPATEDSVEIVRHLAGAALGIFAEVLRGSVSWQMIRGRRLELMLAFRKLLDAEPAPDRRPALYAARLHVSPGYLNEAVRTFAGCSAGGYIRRELVLRAKRQLLHTTREIRKIACELGFDDAAYFTRLFTKETGVSPTRFRRDCLG